MDFREQIDPWIEYVETKYSSGTAGTYKTHIVQFFDWLDKKPLNRCNIEDYTLACVKRKYAKVTVNGKLATIKSFCKWFCPRNDLPDPSTEIAFFDRKETKPKRQRFLTREEYAKVLAVAEEGIELDMVEFLANTGLRRSEFIAFHTKHISKDGKHFTVIGKGNKERQVPMNTKVREIIARSRFEDGSLRCVTFWKGDADRIWDDCQSLARRAMIPGFGPHAFRHYFATRLIKSGIPLKMVSHVLGHSSVLMTEQTYCHILPEDTTDVTEFLCS